MLYTKNSVLTAISSISDISASVSAIINAIKSSDGISAFVSAMENASIELPKIGSQLMGAKKTIAPIVEQVKALPEELKMVEEGVAPLAMNAKETEESALKVEALFAQLMALGMNPSASQLESLEDLKAERISIEAQIAELSVKKRELEEAIASFSSPKVSKPSSSTKPIDSKTMKGEAAKTVAKEENELVTPVRDVVFEVYEGFAIASKGNHEYFAFTVKGKESLKFYLDKSLRSMELKEGEEYYIISKPYSNYDYRAFITSVTPKADFEKTLAEKEAEDRKVRIAEHKALEKAKKEAEKAKKASGVVGSGVGSKSLAEQLAVLC